MLLTLLKGGGGGLPPTPIIGVITETEAVSEAVSRLLGLVRGGDDANLDTLQIQDAVLRVISAVRTITETESVAESTVRLMALIRTISDTEGISETVSKVIQLIRSASDTESISESTQRVLGQIRSVSDAESIYDSATYARTLIRVIAEDVLIAVSKGDADDATTLAFRKAATDVEAVTELLSVIFRKHVPDAISVSESIMFINTKLMVANDTMSIADQVQRVAGFVRIIDEGFGTATVGRTTFIRRR